MLMTSPLKMLLSPDILFSLLTLASTSILTTLGFTTPPHHYHHHDVLSYSTRSFRIPITTAPTTTASCPSQQQQNSNKKYERSALQMAAARNNIPEIDQWKILKSGEIVGVSVNHPTIENGDTITTSAVQRPDTANEGVIMTTKSGSKYKLLKESPLYAKIREVNAKKQKPVGGNSRASPKTATDDDNNKVVITSPFNFFSNGKSNTKQQQQPQKTTPPPPPPPIKSPPKKTIPSSILQSLSNRNLNLNGKSIGNGKYLLSGSPIRTTSGKSQLWSAYATDPSTGDPIPSRRLKVKMTTNADALRRESVNYDRITSGLFYGKFVKKVEYLEDADGGVGFEKLSALVIEAGVRDLKEFLAGKKRGVGLDGRDMRDVAAAAGQCLQAIHASRMVWTDLKTENFVIMTTAKGSADIRGIDLESAMPFGKNPVDYSPEACPPEFATALSKGRGPDFVLDPSYDMWSLGMMLYEVSLGQPYFKGRNPMTVLKNPSVLEVDVSNVRDEKLRDLIGQCLSIDPRKRPSITQFLLHPYFTTSGIGPLSF